MKWKPAKQAIRAFVVSDPPILVHFIPTKARMAPKKPKQTAAIIKPRHTCMYPAGNQRGKEIIDKKVKF